MNHVSGKAALQPYIAAQGVQTSYGFRDKRVEAGLPNFM